MGSTMVRPSGVSAVGDPPAARCRWTSRADEPVALQLAQRLGQHLLRDAGERPLQHARAGAAPVPGLQACAAPWLVHLVAKSSSVRRGAQSSAPFARRDEAHARLVTSGCLCPHMVPSLRGQVQRPTSVSRLDRGGRHGRPDGSGGGDAAASWAAPRRRCSWRKAGPCFGLARRPEARRRGPARGGGPARTRPRTAAALRGVDPEPVFIATWSRQADRGREHPRQRRHGAQPPRRAAPTGTVRHVALVTGLKHYLGPFEAYGKGTLPPDAVPRGAGPARRRELLLCPGGRGLRGGAARRLRLERAPAPHGDRQGRGQCHEHGDDARRLCHAVPRDRPALPVPRLGGAVERAHRHDGRAAARPPAALGHRRPRPPPTRPSTSSTATSSAGAGCGRASRAGSASNPRPSTAPCSRWSGRWRTTAPCGAGSPSGTASPSPTSRASPRPGTRTPTSAGRSRS